MPTNEVCPNLIAAYENMLMTKDQADIEYEADCLDERAIKAGFKYRVNHPEIGPTLYCRTINEVIHVIREMYPTLKNIDVRYIGK